MKKKARNERRAVPEKRFNIDDSIYFFSPFFLTNDELSSPMANSV